MAIKVLAAARKSGAVLDEQGSGDGDLRQLESDATAVAHDLRSNLDQLLAQRRQCPLWVCAVVRRRSSVGANPTRQLSLRPEAIGAVMEVTKWLKPLV